MFSKYFAILVLQAIMTIREHELQSLD